MSSPHDLVRPAAPKSLFASLEKALARLDGPLARLARTGAFAGAITMAAGPLAGGCAVPSSSGADEDLGEASDAVIGDGQSDWAQQQGQRDTARVSYYGENWFNYTNCGNRGGCQGIDLFIKLRVKPAAGANLANKHVGVVYRAPGSNALTTVAGNYFTTWGNGDEEWHVKVSLRSSQTVVSFNAWYQDGVGNTLYDDNQGELHPVAIGSSFQAIAHMWGLTDLVVDDAGAHGAIAVRLADIDVDKQVSMVYTTDNWQTTHWLDMGAGQNQWHWVEDYGADYERWQVDVNLPGSFQQLQYAVVYRHGVQNGATTYEFWDNNAGQNFVVSHP